MHPLIPPHLFLQLQILFSLVHFPLYLDRAEGHLRSSGSFIFLIWSGKCLAEGGFYFSALDAEKRIAQDHSFTFLRQYLQSMCYEFFSSNVCLTNGWMGLGCGGPCCTGSQKNWFRESATDSLGVRGQVPTTLGHPVKWEADVSDLRHYKF